MSLKTPVPAPIGDRKTESFLLRLSKQSQDTIKLLEARGSMGVQPTYHKPQRPLYTSKNRVSASETRHDLENTNEVTNGQQAASSNMNNSSNAGSLTSIEKLAPKLPAKPKRLAERTKAPEPEAPSLPLRPSNNQAPAALSVERQRINILLELPTYVARPKSPEPPVLPSRSRLNAIGANKTSPPPKPIKLLVKHDVIDVRKDPINGCVDVDGVKLPPKPNKPTGLRSLLGEYVNSAATLNEAKSLFKSDITETNGYKHPAPVVIPIKLSFKPVKPAKLPLKPSVHPIKPPTDVATDLAIQLPLKPAMKPMIPKK